MSVRRWIMVTVVSLMLAAVPVSEIFAAVNTDDSGEQEKSRVIKEFKPLNETAYTYEGQPEESELTEGLPLNLKVVLMDGTTAIVPVKWKIAEDYEDTSFYFYSAKPILKGGYKISEDLDPASDIPWITLFRQRTKEERQTGEKDPAIPMEHPEKLDPVYTEKGGPMKPRKVSLNIMDILSLGTEESYAVTNATVKKIYKKLRGKMDMNMAAACGVMTNLYAESGMASNNLENTYNIKFDLSDRQYTKRVNKGKEHNGKYTTGNGKTRYFTKDYCGYGICQWTSLGRRANLLKKAVKKDVSISNLNMQLGFLQDELKDSYPQVWATLQGVPNNARGCYLAAAEFCAVFEVPYNTNNTAASRAKTALGTYWKTYSGKSAKTSGKSYLGICGYTYPKSVSKGRAVTCSGHVISNYRITTVTARILNSKGKVVYSKKKHPGTTIYSLYNFDSSMLFSRLSEGKYTYKIKAKDSHGRKVIVKHTFRVSSGGNHKVVRGCAVKDTSTDATKND